MMVWMMAASVVLPITLFAFTAWIDYHNFQRLTNAQSDLKAAGASVEKILRDLCMVRIMLDGQDFPVMGQDLGHGKSRITGKGANFDYVLCARQLNY